jgi:two-component sensor histidine kinase
LLSRSETWLTSQGSESSAGTAASDDELLLDRIRLGFWLVEAGIAVVFIGAFIINPPHRGLINLVQGINFLVVILALRTLVDPSRRAFNLGVGFAAYAITVISAGTAGLLAGDATTPVVLCLGLSVVTATLIPWSPWWQLASVVLVAVTAIWIVAAVMPTPRLFWLQNVGTLAPTLAATVVITHVLGRHRRALGQAECERRSREGTLREANVRLEREIQEHQRTEDALRFAMRELDHRVKNTLATVQSVADQTLRSSATMADFSAAFSGRVQAMARIHTALAGRRWEGVTLTELIELVVGPYRRHTDSVSIDSDGSFLSSELARVLGMALHELATNAAKYGALSTNEGRLAIWSRVESNSTPRLHIWWNERGGPPISEPGLRGFGVRLIEEALVYEVDGRVDLQFPGEGLRCEIEIPVPPGPP